MSRAEGLCEYCLIHEEAAYFGCEIDHIISEKHGGPTDEANLAYACLFCNRSKGSDIGSIVPGSDEFVRFFHPRTDTWSQHFSLTAEMRIRPLTDIGKATAKILGLNSTERVLERQTLRLEERYPTVAALSRIKASN